MTTPNAILALIGDSALRDDVDRVAAAVGLPVVHAADPSGRNAWTGAFAVLLVLGLLFSTMTLVWLSGYAVAVAKAGDFIRRGRLRRTLEALTGLVLIGLGLRLATESR